MNKLLIFGAGLVVGCYMGEAYLKKEELMESKNDEISEAQKCEGRPVRRYVPRFYCTEPYKTKKVAEKELADFRLSASEDILAYGSVSEADVKRYFDNEDGIGPYDEFYGWDDIEMIESRSKVTNCSAGGYMIVLELKNLKKEDK